MRNGLCFSMTSILLVFVFLLFPAWGQEETVLNLGQSYVDMLAIYSEIAMHEVSAEELAKIHECIFQRAGRQKSTHQEYGDQRAGLKSCFPNDSYAAYMTEKEYEEFMRHSEGEQKGEPDVAYGFLTPEIGYLKVRSFVKESLVEEDVVPILRSFADLGVRKLVVNLEDNRGGLLFTSAEFAELFAPDEGMLIVGLRTRQGKVAQWRYSTSKRGEFSSWKIAVLINGGSASGAEVAAAALRNFTGAPLIGTKSYGKGSAQAVKPLSDGGAFSVTFGRSYLSDESEWEGVGLFPDIIARDNPLKAAVEWFQKSR